jgi:NAD(P)-dependent dehydrogenase (short-subunit alcohol dehydrogenase family)
MTATAGRVAVVTGAARGIGQAIALRLAEAGYALALGDLHPADETATAIRGAGGEAFAVECDLGSPGGVALLVREVTGRLGRCDVLVNCAGLMLFRPFGELNLDTWRRIQAVNVEAAFQLCAAFVPGMADRGFGRIVNVASNTVWKPPGAGFVPYGLHPRAGGGTRGQRHHGQRDRARPDQEPGRGGRQHRGAFRGGQAGAGGQPLHRAP